MGAVDTSEGTSTCTLGLLMVWFVGTLTIRNASRYRGSESSTLMRSMGTGSGIGGVSVKGMLSGSGLMAGLRCSSRRIGWRRKADGDGCGDVTE